MDFPRSLPRQRLTPALDSAYPASFARTSAACRALVMAFIGALGLASLPAQAQTTYGEEAKSRLDTTARAPEIVDDAAFGERVGLFNGSLSFYNVDVSLPGNSGLPVQFGRVMGSDYSPNFWAWDIDVPRVTTTLPRNWQNGFTVDAPATWNNENNVEFRRADYWNGLNLRVNGSTSRLLSRATDSRVPVPSFGSSTPLVTKDGWVFMVESAPPPLGSRLVGRAPDGTRYFFQHLVKDQYDTVTHPTQIRVITNTGPGYSVSSHVPETLRRDIYVLYATRVEDRFGNWVNYEWNGARLVRIHANDGREIVVHSSKVAPTLSEAEDPRYQVDRITARGDVGDAGREWQYLLFSDRREVVNPDGSRWVYRGAVPTAIEYVREQTVTVWTDPNPSGGGFPEAKTFKKSTLVDIATCTKAFPFKEAQTATIEVTHPSGASMAYRLQPVRHGRAATPFSCNQQSDNQLTWNSRIPRYEDGWTLVERNLSGPAIAPVRTTYTYDGLGVSFAPGWEQYVAPNEIAQGPQRKVVTATRSDGTALRFTYGRDYGINEGLMLAEETLSGGTVASRVDHTYVLPSENASQAFALAFGAITMGYSDQFSAYNVPVKSSVRTQDGATFTTSQQSFDAWARPTSSTASSSLGYSRTASTAYHDNLSLWVVGQTSRQVLAGVETSRIEFNALAQPVRVFAYGQLRETLAYHPDGALHTATDARNGTTTLTNWYRGVPKNIRNADGTTVSAAVSPEGWLSSVTDENGFTTSYTHDKLGRIASITYPSGAGESYAPSTLSFKQLASGDWMPSGITPGQWQWAETRGTLLKATYFDSLWRPTATVEWDQSNGPATMRSTRTAYDTQGRVTFQSYPVAGSGPASAGTHTQYDALGRVTRVTQDSELGPLSTMTEYIAPFRTRTTNPNRAQTITAFQAFGAPSTDFPTQIDQPEGVSTTIQRDIFGKPTSITRQGGGNSLTRRYVYDGQQRLCKQVDPESGATLFDYDANGNVVWSAEGSSLTGLSCDRPSVPASQRTARTYDPMNRVDSVTFPDGLGNQTWVYTPDGLVANMTVANAGGASVSTTVLYNRLRLPTSDQQQQTGQPGLTFTYGYNALGHLSSITYPSGLTVDYAPNALGQATRAGTFATGVQYYPNGAIRQFTYGNGLVHQMVQNGRQLPDTITTTFGTTEVQNDGYDYDHNGNVAAISDGLQGSRGHRKMTYDGLDRLKTVDSPMFAKAGLTGTVMSYQYDALDNLREVRGPSQQWRYDYGTATNRLDAIHDINTNAVVMGFRYDARGNTTNRGSQALSFDIGGRLRSVTGVESYRYDGYGRRVLATHATQGAIRSFYGHDGVLRHQSDDRLKRATDFVHLGGSLVARSNTPIGPVVRPATAPTLTAPATSTTGSYGLFWTEVIGATRYELQERLGSGAFANVQTTASQRWAASNKANGSYGYRVRACNSAGCGAYSATRTVAVSGGTVPSPAPTLTVPASNSTGSYGVSWTSVSGATRYELEEQVGSGAFVNVQNTAATTWAATGKANGSYGYRVRACNTVGCSAYSATGTVTVGPPIDIIQIPTLTVPATNSTGSYGVSWTSVAGATRYELDEQVASGAFVNVQNTAATTWAASGKTNGSYGYRVRACSATTCSLYSPTGTVTVNVVTIPAPTLTVPATNSTGSYTVSWTSVAGVTRYELEEQVGGGAFATVQNTAATSWSASGKANGSYSYRVRACNSTTCSANSNTLSTTVAIVSTAPVDSPVLVSTAPLATGEFTVYWDAVAGATRYELEERLTIDTTWTLTSNSSATSVALQRPAAEYVFRARACNNGGCGPYSLLRRVVVTSGGGTIAPASAPTLTVPASNTTGSYSVSWTSVSGATRYELEEQVGTGAFVNVQNTAATTWTATGKANGSYGYRARACNGAGCGPYSATSPVTVSVISAPSPAPTLTVPASNTSGSYGVSWTSVAGATRYELEEQVGTGGFVNVQNTAATSWAASGKANGSYSYRVRACNSAGCSAYSPSGTVAVSVITIPPPPTPTVPASNSTGSYGVSWTTSSGATRYELDEQVNGGAFTMVQNTAATSWTASGKASGNYGYRVRACNSAGCSVPSATSTVAVTLVVVPSPAPTLTVPASSSTGSYGVSWTSVSGATRYELDEQVGGGAFVNVQNAAATSWTASGKASGSYAYRVRACNSAGCSSDSATGTVVVTVVVAPSPPSTLTVPASNSTGSYGVSWTSVAGATRYELDEQVGGGAFVNVQNTAATSWAASGKANGSYGYRVRACNTAGCSTYSNAMTTTVLIESLVPTASPVLVSTAPLAGGQFTVYWDAVAGATRYELEERLTIDTTWTLTSNSSATSVALQRPAGEYVFRARACNSAGCGPYSTLNRVVVQGARGGSMSVPDPTTLTNPPTRTGRAASASDATNQGEGP